MTNADLIRLAQEAGFIASAPTLSPTLERFAVLVAEREREECAKVCERDLCNRPSDHAANYFDGGLRHCAAAIRARGEK